MVDEVSKHCKKCLTSNNNCEQKEIETVCTSLLDTFSKVLDNENIYGNTFVYFIHYNSVLLFFYFNLMFFNSPPLKHILYQLIHRKNCMCLYSFWYSNKYWISKKIDCTFILKYGVLIFKKSQCLYLIKVKLQKVAKVMKTH